MWTICFPTQPKQKRRQRIVCVPFNDNLCGCAIQRQRLWVCHSKTTFVGVPFNDDVLCVCHSTAPIHFSSYFFSFSIGRLVHSNKNKQQDCSGNVRVPKLVEGRVLF